jgi:hypothetical protein
MKVIKGPGLFIAQFVNAEARLSNLEALAAFAPESGFTALRLPTYYPTIFDLEQAADYLERQDHAKAESKDKIAA